MRTLIFFTSIFPYGAGETFVENELPFLAKAFGRIFIISNDVSGTNQRAVPDNVSVLRAPYSAAAKYKILSVLRWFNPVIQEEIKFVKDTLRLPINRAIAVTLLATYAKALETNSWLSQFVSENNIDTQSLYLYSYWMNDMAAGIALFKRKHKMVKAFCRAHGWDVYFERHKPPYLPLRNFITENLDASFFISENGRKYTADRVTPEAARRIRLSRLGTFKETGQINPGSSGKLIMVSCSSIIPLKRLSLIIGSIAQIRDVQIEWTHFGSGPLESDIKQYAHYKLSGLTNIKYRFEGQIGNKELLQYYASNPVDLFINLSETEGLPVSMMEAGSFGIPVVATNVGGVSEIINHGKNGLLLPKDCNPIQVADDIRGYFFSSSEVKSLIRGNAIQNWRANYDASKNYNRFIEEILAL